MKMSIDDYTNICKFYVLSSCTKGAKCPFIHDIPDTEQKNPQEDLCYFFLKGRCDDGELCPRSHSEPPCINGTIKKVCFYFSEGRCERGKLCSYMHTMPLVSITQSFCNTVPEMLINASDDVMMDAPKLCRFYKRGMCYFGDQCTSFHDKPERDLETLLSDLRKQEAVDNSFSETTSDEINSSDLKVMPVRNDEIDSFKLKQNSFNFSIDCRKVMRSDYSSSKPKELLNVSSNSFSKPFIASNFRTEKLDNTTKNISKSKIFADVSIKQTPTKPKEFTCKPFTFLKPKECTSESNASIKPTEFTFAPRPSMKSKKNSREPTILTKQKEFNCDPNTLKSKSNDSSQSRDVSRYSKKFSKSDDFAKNAYSLNLKRFSKDFYISSTSREFSREPNNFSKSREVSQNSYISSKPKSRDAYSREFVKEFCNYSNSNESFRYPKHNFGDPYINSREFYRNPKENYMKSKSGIVNLYPNEQFHRNPKENYMESKSGIVNLYPNEQFQITRDCETQIAGDGQNRKRPMTRKQSKSQRKFKTEKTQRWFVLT